MDHAGAFPATENLAALLLLADGRFPAGGYAHSGGLEPAIGAGRVRDLATLEAFLEGRAATAGFLAATFAAAACGAFAESDDSRLDALHPELDARIPSPAQRATSRQLGRQLLRAMQTIRPHPRFGQLGPAPHQPIALGAAVASFGLGPREAAMVALHESTAGPAAASVRLLSLDPFSTHACLARLGARLDVLADEAVASSGDDLDDLPAAGTPLLDISAERHATAAMRLFAS
ncbi:MAG TPA: urease accessory UreF family protein [Marmoricola sp.]|nr:urease accessory UreF family protein [Marmoricola sp.]